MKNTNFRNRASKYKDFQDNKKENLFMIDNTIMNYFCSYVLSNNNSIHKHALNNLYRFVSILDDSMFDKQPIMIQKLNFLRKALDCRINMGIDNKNLILSSISQTMDIQPLLNDIDFIKEISNEEILFVDNTVANNLDKAAVSSRMYELSNILQDYAKADWREKNNALEAVKNSINALNNIFRKNEANKESSDTLFRLSTAEESLYDIHKSVTRKSFKIVTGMQGFNDLLDGGFQKKRAYCIFGLSGGGKSTTLENILYQLWKYNQNFETNDKTKKPCIVLLTMENMIPETVCNLFNIFTHGQEMEKCNTAEEAIEVFKSYGLLGPDNRVEIFIKYRPVNSVDTSYLYKIVEDLEDEGYETIAFLQDYLGRILPTDRTKDSYQDLGTVMNEFKTFAMLKDIPIITAAQMNREAIKIVEESKANRKINILHKLNRSNIGESIKIDQNLDASIIVLKETDAQGKDFIGFKLVKHRYQVHTNKYTIYQPIYPNSKSYVEDLFEVKPAFVELLESADLEELGKRLNVQYSSSRIGGLKVNRPPINKQAFNNLNYLNEESLMMSSKRNVMEVEPKKEEQIIEVDRNKYLLDNNDNDEYKEVVTIDITRLK